MSSQKYERVSVNDQDDTPDTPRRYSSTEPHQSSPPPSFHSRASSPSSRRLLSSDDPLASEAERTLADTFDDGSDSDDDSNDNGDDRQRLMRTSTAHSETVQRVVHDGNRPDLPQTVTKIPGAEAPATAVDVPARPYAPTNISRGIVNDGVFANLNAKPERGEKLEEQPPSYEAAAADATPPYWETTILAPGHLNSSDEVYLDGLPVGSLFSFVWNGMISMSFQLVGFLLTYLLHTTHAAKHGSRAGLGITLVRYGFYLRSNARKTTSPPASDSNDSAFAPPQDPNSHDFDPSKISDSAAAAANAAMSQASQAASSSEGTSSGLSSDWLAYALMIVGWFLLIRAVSDFFKARRHEQLVLQSPDRGLNVPIVADTENPETVV